MSHEIRGQHVEGFQGGKVAQLLGKPNSEWTEDDIATLVREAEIRILSLMHVDGDGQLRALDFLPRSDVHLKQILRAGERADGSSLFPGTGLSTQASDIVLVPRISTGFLDPFSELPTLCFLCSHQGRDREPLPQSPDTIVRRAAERFRRETGVELLAHAELEFFLGKEPDTGDIYGRDDRGYHATAPFVFGEGLRRHAMALLGDLGIGVKYGHAEVGYIEPEEGGGLVWEQHEIELALAPLPVAADAVVLAQWILRNLSAANEIRCSFQPVLRAGHAGSGMHVHFAGLGPDGFADTEGSNAAGGPPDPVTRWVIGGLVRSGGALMAFGNRSRESFLRLRQGKEAPSTITWGPFNRNALVRIPVLARSSGDPDVPPTVEFRLPDGSVHPHLLLAGAAQAIRAAQEDAELSTLLDSSRAGIGTDPGEDSKKAAGTKAAPSPPPAGERPSTTLPLSFRDVSTQLSASQSVFTAGGVFPPDMVERWITELAAQDASASSG